MSLRAGLAGVAALWLPLGVALAQTESAPTEEPSLQQQLEEQKQRLLILERKIELQDEAAQAAAKANPVVKASGGKFSFQSADGANVVKFRGVLHFDARRYHGRHHARNRGHVPAAPRAPDARGHVRQYL